MKPRSKDSRSARGRNGEAAARRPELQEWVENLAQLARANRNKPADEPFDADAEIDRVTIQEIQMHYRALFRMMPPSSRPALAESLEKFVAVMDGEDAAKPGRRPDAY